MLVLEVQVTPSVELENCCILKQVLSPQFNELGGLCGGLRQQGVLMSRQPSKPPGCSIPKVRKFLFREVAPSLKS